MIGPTRHRFLVLAVLCSLAFLTYLDRICIMRASENIKSDLHFTDAQMADVAAFVHTFRAAGYDESRIKPPSIVVGDAKAGEAFFKAKCGACHSPTGDLRGLATKISDPRLLQQTWLMPGTGGGRGAPPPIEVAPVSVTVTLPRRTVITNCTR